ncbi:MAG: hypothetical protein ACTSUQ_07920 [Candidatus Freyarchaeota archaeon]
MEERGGATQKKNRRTRMKRLRVFLVVFFAALMLGIGTGITTVQAYRLPEQNHFAFGVSMLARGQGSAAASLLDAKMVARIENGSLTLQEIAPIRKIFQDTINQGFRQWQKQKIESGELQPFKSQPDNETLRDLFFQFLYESPENAEFFSLYDKLLHQENQILEQQQLPKTNLIFENIDLIVNDGTLIREWNKTITSNGTEFITMCQSYSLEINGTTLNATKVTIISSDGTVIRDPYIMIRKTDLIFWTGYWQTITYYAPVWTWFGIIWIPQTQIVWVPVPILYGYDFVCYTHFTPDEAALWLEDTVYRLDSNLGYSVAAQLVAWSLSAIAGAIASAIVPEPIASKAAGAVTLLVGVVLSLFNPIANIPKDLKTKIIEVVAINMAEDPNFGFRFYEYVHAPLTPPIDCLDKQATHAWYYVTATNGIVCATPPFDKPIPVGETYAENWVAFYHYIAQNYGGYDTWLWIGGIPGGTPPT